MTTHLGLQRMLLPSAQVSSLTTGSITLPSARGAFDDSTFELIQSTSMDGSALITFSSIPQTYTHLQARVVANKGAGSPQLYARVNGITGNNYTAYQYGNYYSGANILRSWAGGNTSSTFPGPGFWGSLPSSNYLGLWILNISNYTETDKRKEIQNIPAYMSSATSYEFFLGAAFLNSNNAITSLTFYTSGGETLANGSRVSLYGVKSA